MRTYFYRTSEGPRGSEILQRLKSRLRENLICFFTGAGSDRWIQTINIARRDYDHVLALIRAEFADGDGVFVRTVDSNIHLPSSIGRPKSQKRMKSFHLLCIERSKMTDEKQAVAACTWIEFCVWDEHRSYAPEPEFESALVNPHVRRLRRHTFEEYLTQEVDIAEIDEQLVGAVRFPIDVVYTWVNNKDEEWQRTKAEMAGIALAPSASRANHDERFNNRDELKYSLRSLELFAPFVRNVYLVTNGQVPEWLDLTNDRIKLVTHADIYRHKDHLPTFNSSSIETQLHHIDGLAEHFLYFNDDFFLGDFCVPEDFFLANGVIKYFPAEQRAFEHDIDERREEYISADANALALIKEKYGAFTRELMIHSPYPASKSLLYDLESEFQEEFDLCASQRFRSHKDLRPIAFMQYHVGFQKRKAVPAEISNRYLALWRQNIDKYFGEVLDRRTYKTFCINDVGVPPSRAAWTNKQVWSFLESYFPFKSSFEL
ncbi:Stealth protein CR1, conserved region 1 [Xaviernesmea oryzae]|uniref:Capsular polysaccharide phosphotransferase SacB n=1 Tax=Xaviernesmea oryzae TaxID=464029 RepID=A0A1X7FTI0_9HYPH|nr:Stealth protein CR1, conserved region 1 [Xaviernesmea oryzae]